MTNIELVEYAKECLALGENSVYVYGSFGNKLTSSFCDSKYRQYPNFNTISRTSNYKKLCDGKHYAFDCVGLIKSFYWGGYKNLKYNSSTDVSADGMYERARTKGKIDTMDKSKIGLLIHMPGHIGIYVGNNEVIECTISTAFAKQKHGMGGICKTKLSDRKWINWLECPYITYENSNNFISENAKNNFLPSRGYFKRGDTHQNIGKICYFFAENFYGYYYKGFGAKKKAHKVLDGNYFGPYCEVWTKKFQKNAKTEKKYNDVIDGCIGPKTLQALKKYGFKE